jgi:hypothetical protein
MFGADGWQRTREVWFAVADMRVEQAQSRCGELYVRVGEYIAAQG